MTADVAAELHTIIDLIRYGASRFNAAGLTFGHSYDNALDEATQLTLHALHLPHDLPPAYGNARVTEAEKEDVLGLFLRRIEERIGLPTKLEEVDESLWLKVDSFSLLVALAS